MAKEYRRKPDTSVELVSVHQEFTDPEFEDHKGLVGGGAARSDTRLQHQC
ncbi:MAG: hypothetical protein ACYSW8_33245 [Planctomycetota bacterium]|jgi:hypothetical protein